MHKKLLIAFDIDGTLKPYGGPNPIETLYNIKNRAIVGIVSGRPDAHVIASRLNLDFSAIGKKNALEEVAKEIAKEFPNIERRIYVGDMLSDEIAARHASPRWEFIHARNFREAYL